MAKLFSLFNYTYLQFCQFSKWFDSQMMFVQVDQEMELVLQRKFQFLTNKKYYLKVLKHS